MKIGIGNDHAGTDLKLAICQHLDEIGVEYIDYGIAPGEKIDYPDAAERVCRELVDLFLTTEFEGGRHQRRVDLITKLEEKG